VCGIFGCLSDGATQAILEGLKRLEYRGYDSVGIAVVKGDRVIVEKAKGRIADFITSLDDSRLDGDVGIGHTRWATHGAPCKESLTNKGHRFTSNTDTEVIPHLIEDKMVKEGFGFKEAVLEATKCIKGSMACVIISSKEPDKMICVRRESPLVLGLTEKGAFCASDIPALLPFTRNVMVMPDDAIAIMKKGKITLEGLDGRTVEPAFTEVTWNLKMAEKGGYPHFMIKEIFEQPIAVRETLKVPANFLDAAAELLNSSDKVYLTGSGTSYHACLSASYQLSGRLGLDTRSVLSSEFADLVSDLNGKTVLAVSQSGETADTLSALRYAKGKGAKIVGITNTLGSSITVVSNKYICTQSGPEIGVAATKTFLTQLTALDLLILKLKQITGAVSEGECNAEREQLNGLPGVIASILERSDDLRTLALKYFTRRDAFFLARGPNVATALEGALKLKEISYIHAEGYPAGESKHGPISLVEPGFLCVFVAPQDSTRGKVIGNVMEMKARGAYIFSLVTKGDEEMKQISDDYFEIPKVPDALYPIVSTVPLQLFAYYVTILRGLDPDKPRNLAKSVTVL